MHSEFFPLLLITGLAFIVPVLTSRYRRIRLPIVVGEIVAGMIIGKSGFNLVQPSETLSFLADFGFTFLMFLSGLEINFGSLASAPGNEKGSTLKRPVPLAFISFGGTLALAMLVGLGLWQFGLARSPFLMGLILSTTSLGIVVPILKERSLTGTHFGQILLVSALVSDFVTLLLLSLTIAIIASGISLNLFLFILLLLTFVIAAKISQWMRRFPLIGSVMEELSHATAQIRVRGAFALMVMWVVLAAALGVEVILGAFLAGAVLSISSQGEPENLRDKLDAIGYGFFIPIFFINIGANFDLPALLGSPAALVLLPVLILAAYLVKFIPALVWKSILPWRETLAAGALLSSRLSLIIAASAIALDLGLVTSATNSAVILVAIISCTVSPLLFARIYPSAPVRKREGIVILGTDQLALLLGQRLKRSGERLSYIGVHLESLATFDPALFNVIPGDPTDEHVLEAAGLHSARGLISVTNDQEALITVCQKAVEHYQVPVVIARADENRLVQTLQAFGVRVVQPAIATALALEGALEFPTAFSLLTEKEDNVEVRDILLENARLSGLPLRQIRLPGNALVIGIKREGEVIVPHGDTRLNHQDNLLLVGSPECLVEAENLLNGHAD